jgi:hypothetical protein
VKSSSIKVAGRQIEECLCPLPDMIDVQYENARLNERMILLRTCLCMASLSQLAPQKICSMCDVQALSRFWGVAAVQHDVVES